MLIPGAEGFAGVSDHVRCWHHLLLPPMQPAATACHARLLPVRSTDALLQPHPSKPDTSLPGSLQAEEESDTLQEHIDTPVSIAFDPSDPAVSEAEPALREPAAVERQRRRQQLAALQRSHGNAVSSGKLFQEAV